MGHKGLSTCQVSRKSIESDQDARTNGLVTQCWILRFHFVTNEIIRSILFRKECTYMVNTQYHAFEWNCKESLCTAMPCDFAGNMGKKTLKKNDYCTLYMNDGTFLKHKMVNNRVLHCKVRGKSRSAILGVVGHVFVICVTTHQNRFTKIT